MGGRASAKGKKTANRGFASMDKNKQREISSMGGKASGHSRRQHPGTHDEDTERRDYAGAPDRDTETAKDKDNAPSDEEVRESLSYSETDEDEDEGLGDGNLGRSVRGDVGGK